MKAHESRAAEPARTPLPAKAASFVAARPAHVSAILAKAEKMQFLRLGDLHFSPRMAQMLTKLLAQGMREQRWPGLRGLDLSGWAEFGFDCLPILHAMQDCHEPSAINRLCLDGAGSTDALCGEMAKLIAAGKLPHLQLLSVPGPGSNAPLSPGDASGVEALFESLIEARTPLPLADLRLPGQDFNTAALEKLLEFLARPAADELEILDLTNCGLSDFDLAKVFQNLQAQSGAPVPLRQLSVAFNRFASVAGTALAEAFSSGALRTLEKLDLSCQPQAGRYDTVGPYEKLLQALAASRAQLFLRELYLQGIAISDQKLLSLEPAMRQNGPLERLQTVWMQNHCFKKKTAFG